MSVRYCFLLAPILAFAAVESQAQSPASNACPWLTQGTAARALAGEVSVAARVSDTGEGTCSFTRMRDAAASLKVEVSKSELATCGGDATKLKGVGNEAKRCKLPGSADPDAELVSGRVRDLHFTISFTPHAKPASANSSDKQDDELQHVAELVAGNLF